MLVSSRNFKVILPSYIRWLFQIFCIFTPEIGDSWTIFTCAYFQMGWFNSTANECMVNIQKVVKSNGKSDSQNGQKAFQGKDLW